MYTTANDGTKVGKGLKMVLEERGVSTVGKGADWMRETLAKHSHFRDEKSMIEFIVERTRSMFFDRSFTLNQIRLRGCGLS